MDENRVNEEVMEVMEPEVVVDQETEIEETDSSGFGVAGFAAGFAAGVGVTKAVGWVRGKIKNGGNKLRKATVRKILEKEGIEVPEDYKEVTDDNTEEAPKKKSKKKDSEKEEK